MTADIAVEIRTLEPATTIAVRLETTVDRLSEVFDTEMPRIGTVLSDVGGQMAGAPFARYHHYGPERVDVEVGAPIAFVTAGLQPISGKPDGIMGVSSLPGGLAAVTIHSGAYDTLSETYDALAAWIAAEGHTAGDGPWEIYVSDPGMVPDPADLETEIVWPITVASSS